MNSTRESSPSAFARRRAKSSLPLRDVERLDGHAVIAGHQQCQAPQPPPISTTLSPAQPELPAHVIELGQLRLFERRRRLGEIGPAVDHLVVEPQPVEVVADVVVVVDVLPRAGKRVGLGAVQPAEQAGGDGARTPWPPPASDRSSPAARPDRPPPRAGRRHRRRRTEGSGRAAPSKTSPGRGRRFEPPAGGMCQFCVLAKMGLSPSLCATISSPFHKHQSYRRAADRPEQTTGEPPFDARDRPDDRRGASMRRPFGRGPPTVPTARLAVGRPPVNTGKITRRHGKHLLTWKCGTQIPSDDELPLL